MTEPSAKPSLHHRFKVWGLLVAVSFVLLIADKALLVSLFSSKWTDDDQTVLWATAYDLLHGHFREPRFYGQSYNTWLESLVALPLLGVGLPFHVALPLATAVLGLTPFILLSRACIKAGSPLVGWICLFLPLTFTWQLSMYSSMPRGFVTGIATAALGCHLLGWGLHIHAAHSVFRLFLGYFLLTLSVSVNPNSLPLVGLVGGYFTLCMLSKPSSRTLLPALLGVLFALMLHGGAQLFYRIHPDYIAHTKLSLRFTFKHLVEGFSNPWNFFGDYRLQGLPRASALALPLVALAFLLRQPQTHKKIAGLVAFAILLAALGFEKIHDGSPYSIYQPLGRFFLALPMVCLVCLAWGSSHLSVQRVPRQVPLLLLLLTVLVFAYRVHNSRLSITRLAEGSESQVQATRVPTLESYCSTLHDVTATSNAEVILFRASPLNVMATYACPLLIPSLPPTLLPVFDRRTWRMHQELVKSRTRVLLVGYRLKDKKIPLIGVRSLKLLKQEPLMISATIEPQPTLKFLLTNGFAVRKLRDSRFRQWKKTGTQRVEVVKVKRKRKNHSKRTG